MENKRCLILKSLWFLRNLNVQISDCANSNAVAIGRHDFRNISFHLSG